MNISPVSNQSFSGILQVPVITENGKKDVSIADYQITDISHDKASGNTIINYIGAPSNVGVKVPCDLNTVLNAYNAVKGTNILMTVHLDSETDK